MKITVGTDSKPKRPGLNRLIPISRFPISPCCGAQMAGGRLRVLCCSLPEIMRPVCLITQAERLKEQASCWEKEERSFRVPARRLLACENWHGRLSGHMSIWASTGIQECL